MAEVFGELMRHTDKDLSSSHNHSGTNRVLKKRIGKKYLEKGG